MKVIVGSLLAQEHGAGVPVSAGRWVVIFGAQSDCLSRLLE
jgi:hypothetical protein